MREEIKELVQAIFVIILIIGIMMGINHLTNVFLPNALIKNYELPIQKLEEQMSETDDNDVKLYYKMKIIEIQEELNKKIENNFMEEKATVLIFPLLFFLVFLTIATDRLMDLIFECVEMVKEKNIIPNKS